MTAATLDPIFDALASRHRRRIVDHLTAGPVDTPTLGARFAMSKQALNRHLLVLEQAGLVERRLQGRVHQLTLVTEPLDGITTWVSHIRRGWEASFDRLDQVMADMETANPDTDEKDTERLDTGDETERGKT
jgi:DNA-binding transcriptional ArsR family regulator